MREEPYLFPQEKRRYQWSSQFGLYRYRSGDDGTVRYRSILNKRSNIRFFVVLAMFGVAILFLCYLMYTSSREPDAYEMLPPVPLETPLKPLLQRVIDLKHNSTILRTVRNSTTPPPQVEKLVQPYPNQFLRPPPPTPTTKLQPVNKFNRNLHVGETKDVDEEPEDEFHPMYFDEFIPNLQPPPPSTVPMPMMTAAARRNFRVMQPYPFRIPTPKPQMFTTNSANFIYDKKYPQVRQADNYYRYPQHAMNIQEIIKYLTRKQVRKQLGFSGRIQTNQKLDTNNEPKPSTPQPMDPYTDPFYRFKPPNPSDINLLAPKQYRFAPQLIQNHKLSSDIDKAATNNIDTKPVSVMLDIYPMPSSTEEAEDVAIFLRHQLMAQRAAAGHPAVDHSNLNRLYQLTKVQKSSGGERSDGYAPGRPSEKMKLHLNLYPTKQTTTSSEDRKTQEPPILRNPPRIAQNRPIPISFESGFMPVQFNNATFHSEPLDKNYMVHLEPIYNRVDRNFNDSGESNMAAGGVQYYEPKFQDIQRRNYNFTLQPITVEDEYGNVEQDDNDEEDPNLKNHRPFFSEWKNITTEMENNI